MKVGLGLIHTHFVHSISNSKVNHCDRDSIKFLYCLFDDEIAPYSTSHIIRCLIHRFFVVTICYRWKWIDRGYFNMIDCRIGDLLDERSVNTPLNKSSQQAPTFSTQFATLTKNSQQHNWHDYKVMCNTRAGPRVILLVFCYLLGKCKLCQCQCPLACSQKKLIILETMVITMHSYRI